MKHKETERVSVKIEKNNKRAEVPVFGVP